MQCRGGCRRASPELSRVDIAALGVGDDGHATGLRRGVPGDRLEAIESDEGSAGDVGQRLGRRDPDAQPGVGTGAQANADRLDITQRNTAAGKQVDQGRNEVTPVSLCGYR